MPESKKLPLRARLSRFVHGRRTLRVAKHHLEALPTLLGTRLGARRSWSQHGEDGLLVELLAPYLEEGYYVDVGANHPTRRSNTYRLYCLGMRGITAEPNLELHRLLRRYRPGDIHLAAGVGAEAGIEVFHEFNYHVFSTYAEGARDRILDDGSRLGAELIASRPTPVFPLREVVANCRPPGRDRFVLLSVDTEGADLEVLRSNDWDKLRPLLVMVEANSDTEADAIGDAMGGWGYAPAATFGVNLLFQDQFATAATVRGHLTRAESGGATATAPPAEALPA